MFWNKRVFGLEEALGAEAVAPMPADHAVTVMSVLTGLKFSITAGTEAAEKIAELKDSVKQVEGDLTATKITLRTAPDMATFAIGKLRFELNMLVEGARESVRLRTKRINSVRDAIIGWVNKTTDKMTDRAWSVSYKQIDKMGVKFSARIKQVETDLRAELASLRDAVSQLEAESFYARAEIGKLEPIAKKWILPVKK